MGEVAWEVRGAWGSVSLFVPTVVVGVGVGVQWRNVVPAWAGVLLGRSGSVGKPVGRRRAEGGASGVWTPAVAAAAGRPVGPGHGGRLCVSR